MTEIFQASRLKIERAKQHVACFDKFLDDYVAKYPPVLTHRPADPDKPDEPPHTHLSVRGFRAEDGGGPIVGDAIHNLRAALDLMAVELVELAEPNSNTESVYFPFAKTAAEFPAMIKRREFDRAGKDAVALLMTLQPYRGGNEALRALHDLDIQDKHKALIPIAGGATFQFKYDIGADGKIRSSLDLNFAPRDMIPALFPRDSVLTEREILPALHELVQLVEGILESFAAMVAARA